MDERVKALEDRVGAVEAKLDKHIGITVRQYSALKQQADTVAKNSEEILSVITGAKRIWGVTTKHWRSAILFGAGVMTSLGVGNPELLKFVTRFFSGVG